MKTIILSVLLFFPLLTLARIGNDQGNGGIGVLCHTTPVPSLELFDLYEGRVLQRLIPVESKLDYTTQALSFAAQLDAAGWDPRSLDFEARIKEVLKIMRLLPPGVGLTLTPDADNLIYPKKCDIVQILNFKNDGNLYVDSDLWAQLSETQKAAAILHEVIYDYLRRPPYPNSITDGDFTSVRTRRAVALLMAGKKLARTHLYEAQDPQEKSWMCRTDQAIQENRPSTEFWVHPMIDGQHRIEFRYIRGLPVLSADVLNWSGDFKKIALRGFIQSLIDWDIEVQILSLNLDGSSFEIYIFDGNQVEKEKINCVQEL